MDHATTEHEIKTWPPFFQARLDGRKLFEVRQNDRGYAVGHRLLEREYVRPDARNGKIITTGGYTGRWIRSRITYMMEGGRFGLARGWCVMALENIAMGEHHPQSAPPRSKL